MPASTGGASFETTHWSRVAAAADPDPQRRQASLAYLMERYWKPVYACLRRGYGVRPADAEDLTQEFFALLLEREVIERARPEKARFRTYIKAVLRNFHADHLRRGQRVKRGAGRRPLSLDVNDEDERMITAISSDLGPDEILDRLWARALVDGCLQIQRALMARDGRGREFEMLLDYTGRSEKLTYKELAAKYGLTEWNVWKLLSRALAELKELMRAEVAETVETPEDVEDEMEQISGLLG